MLRDQRKNLFFKGFVVAWQVSERLFQLEGVDPALLQYYTMFELEKGPAYLRKVAATLEERKKGFSVFIEPNGNTQFELADFVQTKKVIEAYQATFHAHASGVDVIKGQVGCAGLTRGKVRVILNVALSGATFQEGEVLVAGMTRPEYVSLMKKAAAIVTDEGGITCHAAIVSRELGKPCIIGTKIATKVLRDGDEVEVDAEMGVVRILKKT